MRVGVTVAQQSHELPVKVQFLSPLLKKKKIKINPFHNIHIHKNINI